MSAPRRTAPRLDEADCDLAATLADWLRVDHAAPPAGITPDQGAPPVPVPVPDWRAEAACRGMDPNVFFPEPAGQAGAADSDPLYDTARAVCRRCASCSACLAWAEKAKLRDGCYGGQSPRDRGFRGGRVARHATEARYRGGCRCDLCSAARAAAARRRYAARKAAAS